MASELSTFRRIVNHSSKAGCGMVLVYWVKSQHIYALFLFQNWQCCIGCGTTVQTYICSATYATFMTPRIRFQQCVNRPTKYQLSGKLSRSLHDNSLTKLSTKKTGQGEEHWHKQAPFYLSIPFFERLILSNHGAYHDTGKIPDGCVITIERLAANERLQLFLLKLRITFNISCFYVPRVFDLPALHLWLRRISWKTGHQVCGEFS